MTRKVRLVEVNKREPNAKTTQDFPGLFVQNDTVTGSIRAGQTRLPLWCLMGPLIRGGFAEIEREHTLIPAYHGKFNADLLWRFLYSLMGMRGDFARLLCVLADVERREQKREGCNLVGSCWWEHLPSKRRVTAALSKCLDNMLEDLGPWGQGYIKYKPVRKKKR